jgi:hypothetical protein
LKSFTNSENADWTLFKDSPSVSLLYFTPANIILFQNGGGERGARAPGPKIYPYYVYFSFGTVKIISDFHIQFH